MQFWISQSLVESCPLLYLAMNSHLFQVPCFLVSCSPAAISALTAGAPTDPTWDAATGIFLPEYADVLLADGVCGRMLPFTEGGWFGFSMNRPGLEHLTSGDRGAFVKDVRSVLHGVCPSAHAFPV